MSDAASLLAKLASSERAVKTLRATVSAYRADGRVNLAYGTGRIYGVPCLGVYTNRQIGDVVQALDLGGNTWVVLGRIGDSDSAFSYPVTQNSSYYLYDNTSLNILGTYDSGFEGHIGSSGQPGETAALLAWSYYNGTSNRLVTGAAGKTSVTLTVARSSVPHGQNTAVSMQLVPHAYDALPTGYLTLATTFTSVTFQLEIGEIRNIALPPDWVTGITATTPTIRGFAVQPVATTPWQATYAIFGPLSGGFRVA